MLNKVLAILAPGTGSNTLTTGQVGHLPGTDVGKQVVMDKELLNLVSLDLSRSSE